MVPPGGPIGKIRRRPHPDHSRRGKLVGSLDLVGDGERRFSPEEGAEALACRTPREDLAPDPNLPDDTRIWAALQNVGGGAWGGCVYDVDAIIARLTGS